MRVVSTDLKLLTILAFFWIAIMEPVSWVTSQTPAPCVVEPSNYAANNDADNKCPTFHIFLIKSGTSVLETLGHEWLTAIATAVIAFFTISLASVGNRQNENTKILQRAFISVEPAGIRPFSGNDKRIACDIIIRNAGNLAARNLSWLIKIKYSEDAKEDDFRFTEPLVGDIVIAPRGTVRKGSEPTTRAKFDKARRRAKPDHAWLYAYGRVSYHDGFRDGRYIDFCHRYNLRGATGYVVPDVQGRYHENGNRTDEG